MTGKGSPRKRRKKRSLHLKIPIKALSTNKIYAGRKHRSIFYKRFRKEVFDYLNNNYSNRGLALKGNLKLTMEVGFSSKLSDLSNSIKAIEDIIVEWAKSFDDRQIARIELDKYIVYKGEEFMNISITKLRRDIDLRRK